MTFQLLSLWQAMLKYKKHRTTNKKTFRFFRLGLFSDLFGNRSKKVIVAFVRGQDLIPHYVWTHIAVSQIKVNIYWDFRQKRQSPSVSVHCFEQQRKQNLEILVRSGGRHFYHHRVLLLRYDYIFTLLWLSFVCKCFKIGYIYLSLQLLHIWHDLNAAVLNLFSPAYPYLNYLKKKYPQTKLQSTIHCKCSRHYTFSSYEPPSDHCESTGWE